MTTTEMISQAPRDLAVELSKIHPSETDRRLCSKLKKYGIDFVFEGSTHTDYLGTPTYVTNKAEVLLHRDVTQEDIDECLRIIGYGFIVADPEDIENWIIMLESMTRKQTTSLDGAVLKLEVYKDKLLQYPADVVRFALDRNPPWVFFPAWGDLQPVCERLVSKRVVMRTALQKAEPFDPDAETKEEKEARLARGREQVSEVLARLRTKMLDDRSDAAKQDRAILREKRILELQIKHALGKARENHLAELKALEKEAKSSETPTDDH